MKLELHVVELPMTVAFRGIRRRHAVVFEGPAGWAEWSPFEEYDDDEAAVWLKAAMEMAMRPVPEPVRRSVPVNVIVPSMAPQDAARRVRKSRCSTAKVKVAAPGSQLDDDVAQVAAVRDALGPDGKIRIDANSGWSLDQAVTAIQELSQFHLEYAEQPVASVAELRELRRALDARGVSVPIAADESIRRSPDPLAVKDVADIAILKVQPLGGISRALEVAEQLQMPVVVSSALDTSIGLRAGLQLAACLPTLDYACGLQTATLFTADVTSRPLVPVRGTLELRDVVVNRLDEVAAPPRVRSRWIDRFRRVAERLPL